jgi:parallel beta-helix repeat protein
MMHRFAVPALLLGLCLGLAGSTAPAFAAKSAPKQSKTVVFEVCKHGCKYRAIQKAVDAAGSFKFKKKNATSKAVVAVRPGKYVEGVVLDASQKRRNFDGLTIEGTKKNRRLAVIEGKNAKTRGAPAKNGIEAIGVDGVVLKNMWARHFPGNAFFIRGLYGSAQCDGYTMDNLLGSDNGATGLEGKYCLGGRMINSAGYHNGDAALYVSETPCDHEDWTNHGIVPPPVQCQRKPKWTVLKNDTGYENVIGYSGTNSKYVKIVDSAFYNNGSGIVPNTLDADHLEPNGWNVIEHNDVFWNNYDYFLSGSAFRTISPGLGQLGGATVNYSIGVGIELYGSANTLVRDNNVFGNDKWGIASFSGPGEIFVANVGDDAKNINNQVVDNEMGRGGADPNGEFDFWNDATGGGNCWSGNSAGSTFAPGNGKVPLSTIYPGCPQPEVLTDKVHSLDLSAGLQVDLAHINNPATILGYSGATPPQKQECSWVRRVATHPPFQNFKPVEVAPQPGELVCP